MRAVVVVMKSRIRDIGGDKGGGGVIKRVKTSCWVHLSPWQPSQNCNVDMV